MLFASLYLACLASLLLCLESAPYIEDARAADR